MKPLRALALLLLAGLAASAQTTLLAPPLRQQFLGGAAGVSLWTLDNVVGQRQ